MIHSRLKEMFYGNKKTFWEATSPGKFISEIIKHAKFYYKRKGDNRITIVKGNRPEAWLIIELKDLKNYYTIKTAYQTGGKNIYSKYKKENKKRIHQEERSFENANANQRESRHRKRSSSSVADQSASYEDNEKNSASRISSSAGDESKLFIPKNTSFVNIKDIKIALGSGKHVLGWSLNSTSQEIRKAIEKFVITSEVDSMRNYWETVDNYMQDELNSLSAISAQSNLSSSVIACAEARGTLRALSSAMTSDKARQSLDYAVSQVNETISAIESGQKNIPELMPKVLKAIRRAQEILIMDAKQEILGQMLELIKSVEPTHDKSTMKYNISAIGADNVRYLRNIIKPMIYASEGQAALKIRQYEADIKQLQADLETEGDKEIETDDGLKSTREPTSQYNASACRKDLFSRSSSVAFVTCNRLT